MPAAIREIGLDGVIDPGEMRVKKDCATFVMAHGFYAESCMLRAIFGETFLYPCQDSPSSVGKKKFSLRPAHRDDQMAALKQNPG
jgi:hypothetical protein